MNNFERKMILYDYVKQILLFADLKFLQQFIIIFYGCINFSIQYFSCMLSFLFLLHYFEYNETFIILKCLRNKLLCNLKIVCHFVCVLSLHWVCGSHTLLPGLIVRVTVSCAPSADKSILSPGGRFAGAAPSIISGKERQVS